ncbi:glutamate 5-kinase [Sulfurivirga caldicuralii]|uniref:Glutamate 5-kinase n=1 Tax=Sulfurivirga caldicuralii TaxID=364032 RepID=A0A1N6GRR3_9GAMM|nr:glutamate 5-kinase [Sulfurivirga caldicuralii]SIO10065.1 glutamate 5-kinase [Sulfurivirga caldicuralii]
MIRRDRLPESRRWVVKIGSSLLTNDGRGLNLPAIHDWVRQMAALREQGVEVLVVSSGSVAEGIKRLGWSERPSELSKLQAAAAVGQMGLVWAYEQAFSEHNYHTAQILLTHADLSDRQRYLNARNTLRTLLDNQVVPVINENDTVVTDEIRFGDNDTLAALTANLVGADVLVILTDQQGLYEANPRTHPDARLLHEVRASEPGLEQMASSEGGALGRGGMYTKVLAAKRAARSGTATLIANGREKDVLLRLHAGEELGTLFVPDLEPYSARKRWIASQLQVKGRVWLDAGAVRALREKGRSLLPVGVTRVEGNFRAGDVVACLGPDGREVARGLVNFDAEQARQIAGRDSGAAREILGFETEEELIHCDNLVLAD